MEITWEEFCKMDLVGWTLCLSDKVLNGSRFVCRVASFNPTEKSVHFKVSQVSLSRNFGETFKSWCDDDEYGFIRDSALIHLESPDEVRVEQFNVGTFRFYRHVLEQWKDLFPSQEGE